MAEALARQMLARGSAGRAIEVFSAGLAAAPGSPASSAAVETLAELGIDLRKHRASRLTAEMAGQADLVLTMTGAQKEQVRKMVPGARVKTLAEYAGRGTDITDPVGQPLAVYRRCAAQLKEMVGLALRKLAEEMNINK